MRKLLLGLMVLGLVACQPHASSPTPTPQIVQVEMTVGTRPWSERLSQCADQVPGSALIVHELPVTSLDLSQADFALRFGPPDTPAPFAAEVGQDELAIIANPETGNLDRPLAKLREIFLGQTPNENSSTREPGTAQPEPTAQVWSYPPGDDVRVAFEKTLLDGQAIPDGVNLAPDPQAMLEAVAKNAGAIGYVPKSWVTERVSVLNLSGSDQPILALAKSEPQGVARQILLCLQKTKSP